MSGFFPPFFGPGQAPTYGATGTTGIGEDLPRPLVSIDKAWLKNNVRPDVAAATFCRDYDLGEEIYWLLRNKGINTIHSLLDFTDVSLLRLGFKVGHIAELRSALKMWLIIKIGTTGGADATRNFTPVIFGGIGGRGGRGDQRGGNGGHGGAPDIRSEDTHRFRAIWGGIGGAGGEGWYRGYDGRSEPTTFPTPRAWPRNEQPSLYGNMGGPGGWGTYVGGNGGLGEAAYIPLEEVGAYRMIVGGHGGQGGRSEIQGGLGGTGQGSAFPKLLYRIDEDTRRQVPLARLEALKISAGLRQRLQDRGFRTVGGLLEAYDTDVAPPHFKVGHANTLTGALRKFVVGK
ncbi:hypothetical protein B0H11DRAFT_2077945 [Mycena galericulata]|nr:hypothetical protein B0H11DRAFT_2077945 [Mycena galericulata]